MPIDSARSDASAALTQFLRGIGKRGYVLAEAQCGEIARAQHAVNATITEFREIGTHIALAHWPEQFWNRLLAQPTLRSYVAAHFDDPLAHLSAGPRAALLLRLVGGLDNIHGAAVLRVSPPAYAHALRRALHVLHEHGVDEAALRALRERLQQRVKALPEQFLQEPPIQPRPAPHAHVLLHQHALQHIPRSPPRWLRPSLHVALALLAMLFIATFFRYPLIRSATRAERFPDQRARAEQLDEQPVAATLSATAMALSNPDFELLNDPDGQRMASDLSLLSWFDAAPASPQGTPAIPNSPALPESAAPETSAPDTEPSDGGRPGAP